MAAPDHSAQPAEGVEALLEDADRAVELARRLVMAGPKAAHVSASETHELSEWVIDAAPMLRTLAASRGEPYGWLLRTGHGDRYHHGAEPPKCEMPEVWKPLYTTPTPDARVRELVEAVAAIAHAGGLCGLSEGNALRQIRRLTLSAWNTTGTENEQRDRVAAALAAMDQETKA